MSNSTKECPICMDDICLNVNCVTTECGHQFHTSCLMQNVAHNGFGCPYCRNKLAEDIEEEEYSDDETDFDEEEEDEEEDEEEPVGDNEMALHGMRQLFRRANNDIEEAGEREARVVTAEEMTLTLIDAGYNMTDIVKAFMINTGFHLHYPDDTTEEDEFVEKIETHMEKVLNYEIPIVPTPFTVYPTSNQEEEEKEEKEEEEEEQDEEEEKEGNTVIEWKNWVLKCGVSRYQFENEITSILIEKKSDIAQPKTTNKKNKITVYDDECL